jgi:MFS family permease
MASGVRTQESEPQPKPVLGNRNLLVIVLGCTVSAAGTSMALTTILLHLEANGASAWAVTGALVAETAPTVVLAPVAGYVVDRFGPRVLIVASSLWQFTACVGIALAPPIWTIYVLVFSMGCAAAVSGPTFVVLLPRLVGDDRVPQALSLLSTTTRTAAVAGPALAGFLYETAGITGPFLVNAASYVALTTAGIALRIRRPCRRTGSAARFRPLDGMATMFGQPTLRSLALVLIGFSATLQVLSVVQVYLVRDTFAQSAATYGTLVSIWTLAALAGSATAGVLKTDLWLKRGFSISAGLLVQTVLMIAAVPVLPVTFAAFALGGFANGVFGVAAASLLVRHTPRAERGRAVAILNGLTQGAALAAYGVGGVLASALPPRQVYGVAGVIATLLLMATLPSLLRTPTRRNHS